MKNTDLTARDAATLRQAITDRLTDADAGTLEFIYALLLRPYVQEDAPASLEAPRR